MTSYVLGQRDVILQTKTKHTSMNDDNENFNEEDIRRAFHNFDMDKNGV